MKLIRLLTLGLILMMVGCVTTGTSSYKSPTVNRIYDENGTLVGKERVGKYKTRIYDADGKLVAKKRHGKYCDRVYDTKGRLLYKIR